MNVKIDTKEKFNEITINEAYLSANMTDEMELLFDTVLKSPVKNTIVLLSNVTKTDNEVADKIASLQQLFFEHNASFVLCGLQPAVTALLNGQDLADGLNITPTLSEAWDIVQMEEIERELMNDL